jgi:hypothetical protein
MKFKEDLLELIDQLLILFENKNKIIYKKLIFYHHHVRNQLDEDDLKSIIEYCSRDVIQDKIKNKDINFLKNTRYYEDVNMLWSELDDPENKISIWQWINVILKDL